MVKYPQANRVFMDKSLLGSVLDVASIAMHIL
jgi:hypothetical protein